MKRAVDRLVLGAGTATAGVLAGGAAERPGA
jgi:hypothetical protein